MAITWQPTTQADWDTGRGAAASAIGEPQQDREAYLRSPPPSRALLRTGTDCFVSAADMDVETFEATVFAGGGD